MTGGGRLRVQRRLEAMRAADNDRPPAERRHRVVSQQEFLDICAGEGGVSSPEQLLLYLDNSGIVFYRKGLFGDGIVLDQQWALDAIYAVFQRHKCYRHLLSLNGRFTRELLEALVWQDFSDDEQELFVTMMRSCGICFVHRRGDARKGIPTWYIAPDLLPERPQVEAKLAEKWNPGLPVEEAVFEFTFLHHGVVRAVVARVGSKAGTSALYWRGGVCVYEGTTRSHALIEQEPLGEWGGRIVLKTQGGQAADLCDRLADWIAEESATAGLEPSAVRRPAGRHASLPTPAEDRPEPPPLKFTEPAATKPQWYVSYSWGDDKTPAGRAREAIVDKICAEAVSRGLEVQRDRDRLGFGESISAFMRKIGEGDRIFIVISEKYLRSSYCMFELFEIWRTSKAHGPAFLDRIRVFALPDANAWTPADRIARAAWWKQEHDRLAALMKDHGHEVVGERDFKQLKQMQDFYTKVSDILALIGDMVQPRTWEDFVPYGFDDPPR